jgi:HAE1 family hydrophobic/amphiphilic exporter-1
MIKKFVSYLSGLRFDPKLYDSFQAKYIVNIRFVLLLIFLILGIGITSFLTLPKRLNPAINLTIVQVSTVLPGSGPADVESLVTIPLEDKLLGVSSLDTLTSSSQENFSLILMQFKSGVDKNTARNDVQAAVTAVTTLPSDAQTPTVSVFDFENQPIWTFTLHLKSDTASLMRYADDLKTKIKALPNIDSVALNGFDTQEIQIILNQQKIRQYGVNPASISTVIKNMVRAFPSGPVDTDAETFSLAIDAQAQSVDDIRNISLHVSGQPIKLGDIADIAYRSKPNQEKTFIARNKQSITPGVTFSVFKSSTADIGTTVKSVEKLVNDTIGKSNGNFEIISVMNFGEEINKQFTDILGEFQSTILLVFVNLLLFLGIRSALIACMTIPLTFLLSFTWMGLLGQSVNFVSLFALLLAFVTSIDDTIVTVSAMTAYYRTGRFTPHQTGILVWRDFVVPIWTTTVTTVWAFLPLILTAGIIGEFIKPIPVVVATTMYTSTFIAWFITLPMMIVLLKPQIPKRVKLLAILLSVIAVLVLILVFVPKTVLFVPILLIYFIFLFTTYKIRALLPMSIGYRLSQNKRVLDSLNFMKRLLNTGLINTERLSNKYQDIIMRILSSKNGRKIAIICLVLFAVSSYSLIPLGLVKNEFFPKTNADTVYVNLDLPSGTNMATLENETKLILDDLKDTEETIAVLADTGKQFNTSGNESGNSSSTVMTLILVPQAKRKTNSSVIAGEIREKYANYTKGKISVIELGSGPPAGADVQITLLGDDLGLLDQYADKTIAYLKSQPGLINVDKSIKSGTSKLVFVPDKAKMAANDVTIDNLGFSLRLAASGFTADTVKFGTKEEDIIFYTDKNLLTPEKLGNIYIPTASGSIPLSSLGNIKLTNNPTVITREGGKRSISVAAGILPGYSVSDANKNLGIYADQKLGLPDTYEWKTGGVNEENQKSVASIFRAMGLSFLLIMVTMVIEFNSFRQAGMILSLIPFAVSGVFIIFALTGTPLSFPALIGVLALFGVVVTNAMFIVEKINQNRKEGMDLNQAIADAAQGRLEPIMLTSLTSILGLVPITLANALWRGLGGAIISGLMFSGVIMLIYIPVMYHVLYNYQLKKN